MVKKLSYYDIEFFYMKQGFFRKLNKQIFIGALAIVFAAFLWAMDGVYIRSQLYNLPVGLVVFLEHALGFLVFSPFIYIYREKIKKLSIKTWLAIFWVSVFGGMIGTIMITKAFFLAVSGEVTFATVIILQKLQPIFAILLARFILKEKLAKQFYIWAFVAIVASYFLVFGKMGWSPGVIAWTNSAVFFAILAAFSFGSSTVFGKRLVNHLDFKLATALRFGLTAILVFCLIIFTGDIFKIDQVSGGQWSIFVLIVFSSGAGAIFLYYFGLRKVTASTATICELFFPLSSVALDYFINKNILDSVQIISVLVLLFAVFRVVKKGKQQYIPFKSIVVHGDGRGKELGFYTANLTNMDLDIVHGVYKVEIMVKGKKYTGLMHFGYKEVFSGPVSLEVLIKNFSDDIYGEEVEVLVIKKVREVRKFKNIEELKVGVKNDLKYLD